jgi:tRNA(fMet)-specific endonuclease VapC
MIILDTDHLSVLMSPEGTSSRELTAKMNAAAGETFTTTVISVEEIMRGWMAVLGRERRVHRQVNAYRRFAQLFEFFADWEILPFDEPAADQFELIRSSAGRVGTADVKIASIALVRKALLITANRKDFEQVPGLRFEDWLH